MADGSKRDRFGIMLRSFVLAALLGGVLLGTASRADAKPIIYPVKLAPIKIKSGELPPDSRYWHIPGFDPETPIIVLYGRVTSPKPACRRKQPIRPIYESPYESYEDKSTDVFSDAAGKWEGEPVPDFDFTELIRSGKARFWVKVVRKRLGKGRFCAEAKSAQLKV